MNECYEKSFGITSTEVDVFGNCCPAALLRFFQDLATEHASLIGSERDYLIQEYHAIWMLVRVWYQIRRPLKMGEDFDLYVGEEYVGEAISAWVVADTVSRKMLRPASIQAIAAAPVPKEVKTKQLKLIRTPKNRREVYTKTVRFSDLDVNGHMNNTRYADVLMDALTVEELKGKYLSSLQLNYSMECRAGESMTISRDMGEDACYIDGCSEDGTRRFEAILQFRPDYSAGLDVAPDYE